MRQSLITLGLQGETSEETKESQLYLEGLTRGSIGLPPSAKVMRTVQDDIESRLQPENIERLRNLRDENAPQLKLSGEDDNLVAITNAVTHLQGYRDGVGSVLNLIELRPRRLEEIEGLTAGVIKARGILSTPENVYAYAAGVGMKAPNKRKTSEQLLKDIKENIFSTYQRLAWQTGFKVGIFKQYRVVLTGTPVTDDATYQAFMDGLEGKDASYPVQKGKKRMTDLFEEKIYNSNPYSDKMSGKTERRKKNYGYDTLDFDELKLIVAYNEGQRVRNAQTKDPMSNTEVYNKKRDGISYPSKPFLKEGFKKEIYEKNFKKYLPLKEPMFDLGGYKIIKKGPSGTGEGGSQGQ